MEKNLPARPNLEHLRNQAKALLSQLKEGDVAAAETFIEHLPAARELNPAQVQEAGFRLADAQSAIARKSGFANWPGLTRYVEQLRQFEGSWEFVDLEVDGAQVPTAMLGNSRMHMDGDRFRMESPEATYEGIFSIDVDVTPHRIDVEFVEGPEAGKWSYGIYELEADRLKICLGLAGSPRPEAFATSEGSGHALENLVRTSKERPIGVDGGTREPGAPAASNELAADLNGFDVESSPLLDRLQGQWMPTELVMNGKALEDPMLAYGSRTLIGNETKVVFGGQTMIHAKVRFDDSKSPIWVDYLSLVGSSKNVLSLGILEWVGDETRYCIAQPGKPRPEDFSCEKGSGRTLSQWRKNDA